MTSLIKAVPDLIDEQLKQYNPRPGSIESFSGVARYDTTTVATSFKVELRGTVAAVMEVQVHTSHPDAENGILTITIVRLVDGTVIASDDLSEYVN
jgi:hypothetical protein